MRPTSLPTVTIEDADGDVLVINERDFDPAVHTLFGAADDSPADGDTTRAPRGIVDVNGIGEKTAKQLVAAGVATLDALATSTPEAIAALVRVPNATARATDWIADAQRLLAEDADEAASSESEATDD